MRGTAEMGKAEMIREAVAAKKAYLLREHGAGGRLLDIKRVANQQDNETRVAIYKAINTTTKP